jgi:hypothetical protein
MSLFADVLLVATAAILPFVMIAAYIALLVYFFGGAVAAAIFFGTIALRIITKK